MISGSTDGFCHELHVRDLQSQIVQQCKHSVNEYVLCIGCLMIDIVDIVGAQLSGYHSVSPLMEDTKPK